ncbi:MAG: hypothetical protein EPO00_08370, partial [Chloroflexota bacterium]
MVHHGLGHEHHRRLGHCPRRQPRIRDLEIRRRTQASRRATLHHDQAREVAPMTQADALRLARWTVTSGSNAQSRGAVVIEAGDHHWQASSQGNGAVDALFGAVDRALAEVIHGHPRLVGYDVHAVAEGPDAEGVV